MVMCVLLTGLLKSHLDSAAASLSPSAHTQNQAKAGLGAVTLHAASACSNPWLQQSCNPQKVRKSLCSWQTGLVRGVTARRVLQSSALSTRSSIAGRNRVSAAECASHHLPDPSLSLWVTRQPLVRDLSSQQPVPSTRWCYLPTPQTKKLQCHVSTGLERT